MGVYHGALLMMKESDFYNKQDVYKAKFHPLIKDLRLQAIDNNMPMIVMVAVENTPKDTKYETRVVLSATGVHLTNSLIAKTLLAINGFDHKLPKNVENALREVTDYYNRVTREGGEDAERADVELTDDLISDAVSIAKGGDEIDFTGILNTRKPSYADDDDEENGEENEN